MAFALTLLFGCGNGHTLLSMQNLAGRTGLEPASLQPTT